MNKIIVLIITLLFSSAVFSKAKLEKLDYKSLSNKEGKISLNFNGVVKSTPEIIVKDKMIQIEIPQTVVWPKMEKRVTLGKSMDTTLMAYQYNKEKVRFRVLLPYSVKGLENRISLTLNNNSIDLNFPKIKIRSRARKVVKKTKKINPLAYDEGYLDKLVKDSAKVRRKVIKPIVKNIPSVKTAPKAQVDQVSMTLAGTEKKAIKEGKSSFSMMTYIGKFVAFFGVIILLFYGVITLMRKGVIKKGKLGFLNSSALVEVMSSTYVGPKKNVLVVRAHNQVFLVGSSEQGLQLLSELDDVPGVMKQSEKSVFGDNFESNLDGAPEKEFKLKEVVASNSESGEGVAALLASESTEDKVRLSDQIKTKMKSLKQFQ